MLAQCFEPWGGFVWRTFLDLPEGLDWWAGNAAEHPHTSAGKLIVMAWARMGGRWCYPSLQDDAVGLFQAGCS